MTTRFGKPIIGSSAEPVKSINHNELTNKGINTHDVIDAHIANSAIHFPEASINHQNLQNVGTNTHETIDAHLADVTKHRIINDNGTSQFELFSANKIITSLDTKLALSGGVMTGDLDLGVNNITTSRVPIASNDLVNKTYADTKLPLSGGTLTGNLDLGANNITASRTPVSSNDLVNKTYADTKLALSGGTLTGNVNLGANNITSSYVPTSSNDLVNKTYADTKLALSGGTLTGNLDLGANNITTSRVPTSSNDLVNKNYVDNRTSITLMYPNFAADHTIATDSWTEVKFNGSASVRFTAPAAGAYLFIFNSQVYIAGSGTFYALVKFDIRKNGVESSVYEHYIHTLNTLSTQPHGNKTVAFIKYYTLAQGDTVAPWATRMSGFSNQGAVVRSDQNGGSVMTCIKMS